MNKRIGIYICCLGALVTAGCGGSTEKEPQWECLVDQASPDFIQQIGCRGDFDSVSSKPVSASIPGALSVKTVIDRRYPLSDIVEAFRYVEDRHAQGKVVITVRNNKT